MAMTKKQYEKRNKKPKKKSFKLFDSCNECGGKCCKFGPGPYKKVDPETYFENFQTTEAWNTKCKNLGKNNQCKLWGTPHLPQVCRVFICINKDFSKEERETIDKVEEVTCPYCKCEWVLYHGTRKHVRECEVCGAIWGWDKLETNMVQKEWEWEE